MSVKQWTTNSRCRQHCCCYRQQTDKQTEEQTDRWVTHLIQRSRPIKKLPVSTCHCNNGLYILVAPQEKTRDQSMKSSESNVHFAVQTEEQHQTSLLTFTNKTLVHLGLLVPDNWCQTSLSSSSKQYIHETFEVLDLIYSTYYNVWRLESYLIFIFYVFYPPGALDWALIV